MEEEPAAKRARTAETVGDRLHKLLSTRPFPRLNASIGTGACLQLAAFSPGPESFKAAMAASENAADRLGDEILHLQGCCPPRLEPDSRIVLAARVLRAVPSLHDLLEVHVV